MGTDLILCLADLGHPALSLLAGLSGTRCVQFRTASGDSILQ